MLCWLLRSPNARLLSELAATGQTLSHDLLDMLPPSRTENYVRRVLVHTGALPERHEALDRIPAWVDQLLVNQPSRHARFIRPYAHWHVLKRARRRATRHKYPTMTFAFVRTRIRVALELLTWLDARGLTLEDLTQDHLDRWLTEGRTHHYSVRYFLSWAAARGKARQLAVPAIARQHPSQILDEDERWQQLHRCLDDSQLPLDVRAAGALVLLFGLTVSRIRGLRVDHLHTRGGETYLNIGSPPLLVPPKLAALLRQLAESPVQKSRFTRDFPESGWLFPGILPGRPAGPRFSHKLLEHGIGSRPARNAALVALVEDIPPPVLSDLLDLHINTAVRWADIARRDWTHYLAARAADAAEGRQNGEERGNTAPSE